MIPVINRNSDEIFSFQLKDEDENIIDVDNLTAITVDVINITTHNLLTTLSGTDITLDNVNDLVYVTLEDNITSNAKLGTYIFKVYWSIVDLSFPDGSKDSIDDAVAFTLKK